MVPRSAPRRLIRLPTVLAFCLAACGGEEPPVPPGTGRIDVNIDDRGCRPGCAIVRHSYFITEAGSYACAFAQGTAAPDEEVVIPAFAPPAGGRVSVIVASFCAAGDCIRCLGIAEVTVAENPQPHAIPLNALPVCLNIPDQLPVKLPLPACRP